MSAVKFPASFPDSDVESTDSTNTTNQFSIDGSYRKSVNQQKTLRIRADCLALEISGTKRGLAVKRNVLEIEVCPLQSTEKGTSVLIESTERGSLKSSKYVACEAGQTEVLPLPPLIERGVSPSFESLEEKGTSMVLRSQAHEEELKGDACYSENNTEQALSHYRQAQSLNESEPMFEFKVIASLMKLHRLFEIRQIIDKILDGIDDMIDTANNHVERAKEFQNALKQYDLAIDEYSRAIDLDSSEASYWAGRCKARLAKASSLPMQFGERAQICALGLLDAEAALRLNSEDANIWHLKACCHMRLKKKTAAIEAWSRAIQLNPCDASYFTNRAAAQLMRPLPFDGPPMSAQSDLDQALKLNFKHAHAWSVRGDYWTDKGNKKEATQAYERAAQLEPANDLYKSQVARSLSKPLYWDILSLLNLSP
eukprot:Protomagalhaensia_wolfi_Nauph_80__222@NODE_1121_length_1718_cov_582_818344_g439_i1_p1_GENE_NODE_1121_length_1718_cov_582_818344_g439_i1NODE_1121_length_1718_cov_582_818344_g439_i1_p1_ORF_typecomplete_len426_score66_90TPR_2/PF07719_17/0_021TPR_2/PF07719_17/0_016TPR_2/PF07719_17/2_1e05TPR_2/PF07719_17/2_8e02TPR_2/PF07719_17/0_00016TPR_16/PF13432_6/1_4TPR_16/PF13432_6/0_087TPR_16/PF13432_6/3_1e06TPR_16/PF13432_6/1_9e05TPR_11/PF13414_6/0_86TPR_11/PF13414_6/0_00011TPR_11/PF13414_6/20TPR_11/PF13414_6/